MDWRHEYPQQYPTGSLDTMMALIYMALIGVAVGTTGSKSRAYRNGSEKLERSKGGSRWNISTIVEKE